MTYKQNSYKRFVPKEKYFERLYCVKGKQQWTWWRLKNNNCPCCNEPKYIVWYTMGNKDI